MYVTIGVSRSHLINARSGIRPADAEERRQLDRMLEGRRIKGCSTNRAMMLPYVVAKALEGQDLSEDNIG